MEVWEYPYLMEGANFLTPSITLKVNQCYLVYDETRPRTLGLLRGRWRGLGRRDTHRGSFDRGLFLVRLDNLWRWGFLW